MRGGTCSRRRARGGGDRRRCRLARPEAPPHPRAQAPVRRRASGSPVGGRRTRDASCDRRPRTGGRAAQPSCSWRLPTRTGSRRRSSVLERRQTCRARLVSRAPGDLAERHDRLGARPRPLDDAPARPHRRRHLAPSTVPLQGGQARLHVSRGDREAVDADAARDVLRHAALRRLARDGSVRRRARSASPRSRTCCAPGATAGPIGIHGTNEPFSIGAPVSHGCVRLPNDRMIALFKVTPLGTPVLIRE